MASYVVESMEGMTIVTFTVAELSTPELVQEVGDAIEKLIQNRDVHWLALNFQKVEFINSEMLGRFVMLRKKCLTCDVKLKICEVHAHLHRILKLVRLDSLFEIVPHTADALASFRAESAGEGTRTMLIDQNAPGSAETYRVAALAGQPKAQFQLGRCYENGWGVSQDFGQAVSWYEKASGHNHAEAQHALANCYAYGIGVEKDYDEAIQLYRLAAEQGHLEAEYAMGMSYEYGLGVDADCEQAANWYRKAANRGDARAKEALAQLSESS